MNKSISNWLTGEIIHKLNNGLGAIRGYAELALLNDKQEYYKRSTDSIIKVTSRMERTLLIFSSFTNPNSPVELSELVEDVIFLLGSVLTQKGITVRKNLTPVEITSRSVAQAARNISLEMLYWATSVIEEGKSIYIRNIVHKDWIILELRIEGTIRGTAPRFRLLEQLGGRLITEKTAFGENIRIDLPNKAKEEDKAA